MNNRFIDEPEGHTSWYRLYEYFPSWVSIPLDIQKSSSWLLFHQTLYHTFVHHDANGYATWTQILDVLKFWIVMHPKRYEGCKSRREIYEMSADCLLDKPNKNSFYGPELDRFVIYGTPGNIMWVFLKINDYPFKFILLSVFRRLGLFMRFICRRRLLLVVVISIHTIPYISCSFQDCSIY
jgi:hypothetical protein